MDSFKDSASHHLYVLTFFMLAFFLCLQTSTSDQVGYELPLPGNAARLDDNSASTLGDANTSGIVLGPGLEGLGDIINNPPSQHDDCVQGAVVSGNVETPKDNKGAGEDGMTSLDDILGNNPCNKPGGEPGSSAQPPGTEGGASGGAGGKRGGKTGAPPDDPDNNDSGGNNTGIIIGVVCALVICSAVAAALAVVFVRRKRRRDSAKATDAETAMASSGEGRNGSVSGREVTTSLIQETETPKTSDKQPEQTALLKRSDSRNSEHSEMSGLEMPSKTKAPESQSSQTDLGGVQGVETDDKNSGHQKGVAGGDSEGAGGSDNQPHSLSLQTGQHGDTDNTGPDGASPTSEGSCSIGIGANVPSVGYSDEQPTSITSWVVVGLDSPEISKGQPDMEEDQLMSLVSFSELNLDDKKPDDYDLKIDPEDVHHRWEKHAPSISSVSENQPDAARRPSTTVMYPSLPLHGADREAPALPADLTI